MGSWLSVMGASLPLTFAFDSLCQCCCGVVRVCAQIARAAATTYRLDTTQLLATLLLLYLMPLLTAHGGPYNADASIPVCVGGLAFPCSSLQTR